MKIIDSIRLQQVLPKVFEGAESDMPICNSQVWKHDLVLRRGEYYLIEAESGTGKSSLCSYIYGLRDDYLGQIFFDNHDIRNLDIAEWSDIRRRNLALVPQEMRLFPELTAMENVLIKNRLTYYLKQDEIVSLFERLEIGDKIDQPVGRMSIGQQQRVAIIRSLAQPFDFILLDEPVSHLDERNNHAVAQLIVEYAQRQGAAIVSTSVGNPLLLPDNFKRIAL